MEAWRTSCPRMPIWEDAVSNGLVALRSGSTMRNRNVVLTALGQAVLNTHPAALDSRMSTCPSSFPDDAMLADDRTPESHLF
jgi:hypothetical protein